MPVDLLFSARLLQKMISSHLKNTSNAQLRCCVPLQKSNILTCMLRFFIGSRLVLERNLHF
jgi:hypothetical protein